MLPIHFSVRNYMNVLELKQIENLAQALPFMANNVKCDTQVVQEESH